LTERSDTRRKRRPGWFVFVVGGFAAYLAGLAADRAISFASDGWRLLGSCLVTGVTLWLILRVYDAIRQRVL